MTVLWSQSFTLNEVIVVEIFQNYILALKIPKSVWERKRELNNKNWVFIYLLDIHMIESIVTLAYFHGKIQGCFWLVQNSKLRSSLHQERSQGKLVEQNLLSNKSLISSKFPLIFQRSRNVNLSQREHFLETFGALFQLKIVKSCETFLMESEKNEESLEMDILKIFISRWLYCSLALLPLFSWFFCKSFLLALFLV